MTSDQERAKAGEESRLRGYNTMDQVFSESGAHFNDDRSRRYL